MLISQFRAHFWFTLIRLSYFTLSFLTEYRLNFKYHSSSSLSLFFKTQDCIHLRMITSSALPLILHLLRLLYLFSEPKSRLYLYWQLFLKARKFICFKESLQEHTASRLQYPKIRTENMFFSFFYLAGLAKVTGNQISEFPFINHAMQIFSNKSVQHFFILFA